MDFLARDDTLKGRTERFLRSQTVLVASAVLAAASMLLVPPSWGYVDYVDVRTLCILFCFMAVVAGLKNCNVFEILAQRILGGERSVKALCLLLVLLPFLCAMFITNDVALITFVPFSILVLRIAGRSDLTIPVVVLQTAAAILGSMSIPFGNTQNLYISSSYNVGMGEFLSVMLPVSLVGIALVLLMCMRFGDGRVDIEFDRTYILKHRRSLVLYAALFALCVATVLRWVPYQLTIVLTVVCLLAVMPRTLLKVDYGLLLTLLFMFVFAGNMAQIDAVREVFGSLMSWDPTITAIALSQVTGNMPASVLLSEFTSDWQGLLAGIGVGGFGTPIASMASVVSLRIYMREMGDGPGRYLRHYTAVNALMLLVLVPLALVLVRGRDWGSDWNATGDGAGTGRDTFRSTTPSGHPAQYPL